MDYFYYYQSEMFSFYRIPKLLFEDDRFCELSCEAKLLYGLLLDRMCLSQKNHWFDEDGRVFIHYTIENIMENMRCSHGKAGRNLKELVDCGLIVKKRQGLGKPDFIYPMNFVSKQDITPESRF